MKKGNLMQRTLLLLFIILCLAPCVCSAAAGTVVVSNLQIPVGMLYDAEGRLYIAEWGASRVCKYDVDGNRTLVTDAVGRPSGLAITDEGTLFIASYDQGVVYRMQNGNPPEIFASGFNVPAGLLWAGDKLLVANRDAGEIVEVSSDGNKKVLSKGHRSPVGMVKMPDGALVISCLHGGIDHIAPDGTVATITDSLRNPAPGMVADGDNAVVVAEYGGTTVTRVSMDGSTKIVADGFQTPVGLVRMPDGRLLVADWGQRAAIMLPGNLAE